jgi:hypothetical protein
MIKCNYMVEDSFCNVNFMVEVEDEVWRLMFKVKG